MTEVNTALASGHFQNGVDIMPTLAFRRQLAIQCMENAIGTEPGDIGRPVRACRRPQIVECKLEKVPNYSGKWWLPNEKNSKYPSRNIRSNAAKTIQNAGIEPGFIAYATEECLYALGAPQIIR